MARSKKKADPAVALEKKLTTPVPRTTAPPPDDFLSTGCTLLNLAFTGHPDRGVPRGKYLYIVGDSGSAKTWFTFSLFAEAARNPRFDKYRFVHDNAEDGSMIPVEKFFGAALVDRLKPPAGSVAYPVYSDTVKDFYLNVAANVARGPCIYVLDSMDALTDESDEAVFEAELKRHRGGTGKVPGSMGMAKAKTNSKNINRLRRSLRATGSILVVISQTRDMIASIPGLKTRSGGKALRFYADLEIWTSVSEKLTRTHLGKKREYGTKIDARVKKNRVNGREGRVPPITFLTGYGIDDAGSLVDYLIDEGHWKLKSSSSDKEGDGKVTAPEFGFQGTPEALVRHVQDEGAEPQLRALAAQVYEHVLSGLAPRRLPRYT